MGCHRISFVFALAYLILFFHSAVHCQTPDPARSTPAPSELPLAANPPSIRSKEDASPAVLAEQLFRAGKFREAKAQYEESIAKSSDAAAYAGLARVNLKLGKVEDAYAAAEKAVQLGPSLGDAHVALGEIYFRMGRIQDAENEFLVPLQLKMPNARTYLGLSRISAAAFDFRSSYQKLQQARTLDPEDPDIRSAWARHLPREDRIAAMRRYLASADKYRERGKIASTKHALAVLEDEEKHPERSCKLVSQVKATTLALHPLPLLAPAYPLMFVEVSFNGYRARLALNTDLGNGIIVNNEVAQKSKVEKIVPKDFGGLGVENRPEGYTGFVKSIKIGELEFSDCYVSVAEEVSRHSTYRLMDGYINAAMFSQFLVDINIPHSEVRLRELPALPSATEEEAMQSEDNATPKRDRYVAPEMSDWTPVYQAGDSLLIATRINNSPPKLFRLALGSPRNWLSMAAAKAVPVYTEKSSPGVFDESGFLKDTWHTAPFTLQIAGRSFRGVDGVALDFTEESSEKGVEISGDLGVEVLRHVELKIDYRDGLVEFGPGEKQKH